MEEEEIKRERDEETLLSRRKEVRASGREGEGEIELNSWW